MNVYDCVNNLAKAIKESNEFIEFDKKIDIPEYLANMMYLGIIIDTNHFKARVNSRSFEAAARLKDIGADSTLCEELSQEPFDLVITDTDATVTVKRNAYGRQ